MGGALSNAGNVYAWMQRTLQWPDDLQARLLSATPGGHGLTILPFFAGERSPYWRGDLRAVVAGLSLATDSFQLIHAGVEAIALRFRSLFHLLVERLGEPAEVIASGGALADGSAWVQIFADVLGRPLLTSGVAEASSRGAAIFVLEKRGLITDLRTVRLLKQEAYRPRGERAAIYERLAKRQNTLYDSVFGP
jgi:gluconokinase